ncbi:MAG: hypothetical protein N4A72_06845, partial [Bacteroidales bacterium]|nr:hypothetical protein [Bacteroidales bacterium]
MKARMTIYSGFLLILIFFNSHSIFSNQSNSERDIVEATYKSEINHMALYSAGMAAVITTQPASGAVTANDQIYLFVVATGTDLSYQWYKDAVAITGETHSSLSIPNCNTDDAGDYYVEITDNVPATVTSSTATITVNKINLTVTGQDYTYSYGDAIGAVEVIDIVYPAGTNASMFDVLPSASTLATNTSAVGPYAVTVAAGSSKVFNVTAVDGTLTINKAPLTATANNKSMVYGDAIPTYDITYNGFKNGNSSVDIDTEPTLTSTAAPTSNVGDYSITFATAGTDNNYNIIPVDGTVSITAAVLTATADDKSRVYGDEKPTFTITYSGFKNSETVADLTTEPVAYTAALLSSGVGTESIDVTGGVATNYSFNLVSGTLTITAAPLTVTGVDASREYGVANPTLSVSYSGFKNSDSETDFTVGNTPTVSSPATITSDVGTYNIVPAGGVLANYSISHVNGTLTISKAPLTATANDKSMVYGDAVPTYDLAYSGFRNGNSSADVDTEPTLTSTAAATSNVGDYAITFATAGTDNNYAITTVDGTVSVTAAVLTATADDKSRVYGDENPALTMTYSGFKNSETVADLITEPVAYTAAMLSSGVGTESIDVTGGVATNYSFNHVSGTLTITAAPLTVTGVDASREYGVANPTLSVSYSGFKNGETEAGFPAVNHPT